MAVLRQPIVAVLGHVDHGKTSLLDRIRGTTVVEREAGRITQHIGATEVPLEAIYRLCAPLLKEQTFTVPGLLFIDTPGHQAFVTLRVRGGSLADLAVLVVDVTEGLMPQTIESINILRRYRTPFVVAANKIDRLEGWVSRENAFVLNLKTQHEHALEQMENMVYELAGKFYEHNFSAERYDKVTNFQKNIAIVPVSAKTGEGIPDLLLVLIGLAQRFLEKQLQAESENAEGTVIEVKEVKGLGITIDSIVYKGILRRGDTIVIGTADKPVVTKIRALLKPKPLDEIRAPEDRFDNVESVHAAAGIKIFAPNLEHAIAGVPLRTAHNSNLAETIAEVERESRVTIETSDEGVVLKADALGSLEALAFECKQAGIPIKKAAIGCITKRDVLDAAMTKIESHRAVLGFNTLSLPEAEEEMRKTDTAIFTNNVIYKLLEDYKSWLELKTQLLDRARRAEIVHPVKIKILESCVFRISKPAVVGVRVLVGRLIPGMGLMREDGRSIGTVKSIQSENKTIEEAQQGSEVAIAIDDAVVGRNIDVNDILYTDIPENDAKKLLELELSVEEKEVLNTIFELKRKDKPFWGM